MSQTQQSLEAARARIQRLVEEIAVLSKSEVRSEEYYQQFLAKTVEACDGRGGAIWLVGQRASDGKSEFQLAAVVDLDSSLFRTDEAQRSLILGVLSEVVRTKQPFVLPAQAGDESGSLQAQLQQINQTSEQAPTTNRTPYPFVNVPLFLKEQVLGVLQVWLQPYVARDNYTEFSTFLSQLAANVEQHFQSKRLGNLVVENQRLQQLLKFNSDLTGSLDLLEVGRLVANYSRDLLGCERCSVLVLKRGEWRVLAISGQEVVESKSTMVKCLTAFVSAHMPLEPDTSATEAGLPQITPKKTVVNRKELLETPSSAENADDAAASRALVTQQHQIVNAAFFEISHSQSGLMCQAIDADKQVVGVVFAESSIEGTFTTGSTAGNTRLAEWISGNTGRALRGAMDHQDLPFLGVSRSLRDTRRRLIGDRRTWHTVRLLALFAVIAGILLFPWMEEVESDCTLIPKTRAKVVPQTAGIVEEVLVREGSQVKKGDPLARLDVRALEIELRATREDQLRFDSEARRLRGNNDEAGAQIATTQLRVNEEKEKKLLQDIDAAIIRSPIDGVVLTQNIEMLRGVYLQPGADFAGVANMEQWDLHVFINEKEVGKVERLIENRTKDQAPVPVEFILYTHNTHPLTGQFSERKQLSQIAYPHERENALRENAFVLNLPNIQAPAEVRSGFRPDLTGRASIKLGRKPLAYLWTRNFWRWIQLKWVW